jgi:hypothetical protein
MKKVRAGLRITFLGHAICALVFGLIYLFIPDIWGDLVNWPATETAPYRLIGAAMLAFGASSVLAYREIDWDKVILIVRTEIVWTGLGTLVLLWAIIFDGAPAIGWLYVVLMGIWTVLFSIFYNPAP